MKLKESFTNEYYIQMIKNLKNRGYTFVSFLEADSLLRQNESFVLMRHDIDFDIEKATEMANIEADCGVIATYFFLIRSSHYNVLSKWGSAKIKEIIGLGHHIGLHMDCSVYPEDIENEELSKYCMEEVQLLQNWFGVDISIVSYHRPNEVVLSGDLSLSTPLKHTYMLEFRNEIAYYSDSTGRWKYGNPLESDSFKSGSPLHILVHPIWWNDYPLAPYETLSKYSERKHDELEISIARNCSVYDVDHHRRKANVKKN